MRSIIVTGFLFFTLSLQGGTIACAQQDLELVDDDKPDELGFKLGPGARLLTAASASARYSDNFYSVNKVTTTTSVMLFKLRPEAYVNLDGGNWGGKIGTFVESGTTNHNSSDSYLDGTTYADWHWQTLTAHQLNARANYSLGHDPFGTTRTEGANSRTASAELDKFHKYTANLGYIFGSKDSRLKSDIDMGLESKRYYSNTATTSSLDYKLYSAKLSGYYGISDKTQLVARVLGTQSKFDSPSSALTRNAKEYRLRGGVKWRATGLTTGEVLAGYFRRHPDDASVNQFSGFDWVAKVTWKPVTSTSFVFETGRESAESYTTGVNFNDSRFGQIGWGQDWSDKLHSDLTYRYTNASFEGSARTDRSQKITAGLEYALTKKWTLLSSYEGSTKSSTTTTLDNKVNIGQIGVRFAQ